MIDSYAIGFSPSYLSFELEKNQRECGEIQIESDSKIIQVTDLWAKNKDIPWNLNLFDKDSKFHKLKIEYDKKLDSTMREVEVCVSGSRAGEYHGSLILTEEKVGDSIIRMNIWLKVVIREDNTTEDKDNVINTPQVKKEKLSDENIGITGAAILSDNGKTNWRIIIVVILIISILTIILSIIKKR